MERKYYIRLEVNTVENHLIVKGDLMPTPGIPESLNVLLHELRGLGLKVTLD